MKYTFETVREHGLLLYEYIRGSQAYGLSLPTSDEDRGAVFRMQWDDNFGMTCNRPEQIQDKKGDTVWYEVGRYIELLCKANPTMLESLFVPERCIVYMDPLFKKIYDKRDMFLTQEVFNSFCGYAKSQIEKARGLNKKIVNPVDERKDILDFCFTFKNQGTEPFKNFLARNGYKTKYCGLVHLPNMENMYGVYYDFGNHYAHEDDALKNRMDAELANLGENAPAPSGYRGAIDENNETTQLRLSSVDKGAAPICIISYNENGFKTHCRQYKEYQDWVAHRNPVRYLENKEKEFDRKNMMHCARLLTMGIEVAKTGKLNIDRSNIDREFLLNIRLGNSTYDELINYLDEKYAELKEAIPNCTLPKTVDRDAVNDLLIEIRKTNAN